MKKTKIRHDESLNFE